MQFNEVQGIKKPDFIRVMKPGTKTMKKLPSAYRSGILQGTPQKNEKKIYFLL